MEQGQSNRFDTKKQVVLTIDREELKDGYMLVGKTLTSKSLHIPIVINMVKKGWQLDKNMEIVKLDRNQLTFLF